MANGSTRTSVSGNPSSSINERYAQQKASIAKYYPASRWRRIVRTLRPMSYNQRRQAVLKLLQAQPSQNPWMAPFNVVGHLGWSPHRLNQVDGILSELVRRGDAEKEYIGFLDHYRATVR